MAQSVARSVSATVHDWNPEDTAFWEASGKAIAYRNLWISIYAMLLAFSVWMIWSAVVVNLPGVGFNLTTDQLFWLTALPGLSGATLRIFYAFLVPIFGGRNWTAISTALLLAPAVGTGMAVQNPDTPYWVLLTFSALCGLGGANFASSMANISFFFPKSQKGLALGLNAGLGNLGVSAIQFSVPLVISAGLFGPLGGPAQKLVKDGSVAAVWLQNVGFFWAPFIVLAVILVLWGMNNLATAKASFRDQAVIFKRKHNWIICWLYLGTFGSFIGYSAAFPLLIKTLFPEYNPLTYAFLGPLVGAAIRPLGGWLADKLGGAVVSLWNFVVMILAVIGVLYFIAHRADPNAFWGFLLMFIVLFATAGIGNGSVFRMIPVIFLTQRLCAARGQGVDAEALATREAAKESAAVLGFSSAIGAYGAFFIPKSYGMSIEKTGGPELALYAFLAFYLTCCVVTWWYYVRQNAEAPC
ncbi:MAG: NarK family nitrate/nitrite MFS transporter [Armatimonadota bacterium]